MNTSLSRRLLLGSTLATLASSGASYSARAQAWPSRTVKIVVPNPPGAGIVDINARLLGQHLAPAIGQQIVIDNKPGASGNIGTEVVAKAPADGYTLLVSGPPLVVNPFLYATMPYEPLGDLVPVSMISSSPLMLVVHPSVPANSLQELVALAKAQPGKLNYGHLNYGSGGVGSTPFLATELFKAMAGINVTHVPYRGGAPALADLVGGQLTFMIENMPGTLPLVKSGKLRALAVTGSKRAALAPELPTFAEAGVPGYEVIGWTGVFAPKGTPPEILARLNAEMAKLLRSPEVKDQLAGLGAEPGGKTSAEFAAFVRAESARWGKIIKDLGIKPE